MKPWKEPKVKPMAQKVFDLAPVGETSLANNDKPEDFKVYPGIPIEKTPLYRYLNVELKKRHPELLGVDTHIYDPDVPFDKQPIMELRFYPAGTPKDVIEKELSEFFATRDWDLVLIDNRPPQCGMDGYCGFPGLPGYGPHGVITDINKNTYAFKTCRGVPVMKIAEFLSYIPQMTDVSTLPFPTTPAMALEWKEKGKPLPLELQKLLN